MKHERLLFSLICRPSSLQNWLPNLEVNMKKLLTGIFAAAFATTTASAGDLAEPTITEVEEPAAASSSAPWLPLLLLVGVGLLIASQDDNSEQIQG